MLIAFKTLPNATVRAPTMNESSEVSDRTLKTFIYVWLRFRYILPVGSTQLLRSTAEGVFDQCLYSCLCPVLPIICVPMHAWSFRQKVAGRILNYISGSRPSWNTKLRLWIGQLFKNLLFKTVARSTTTSQPSGQWKMAYNPLVDSMQMFLNGYSKQQVKYTSGLLTFETTIHSFNSK
jgi:hypothetical protein